MIIPPNSKNTISYFTTKINNSIIHSSETVKYLGVITDSKLFFASHIKCLETKLSKASGTISRLKSTLPKDALLKLYYALFQPHLLYGLTVWGTTYPTYLKPLQILQNRALKNIGDGTMYENSNPYYIKSNILKPQDLCYMETAKIVYNYVHRPHMLPTSFLNYFIEALKISQRSTSTSTTQSDILYIPLFRSNKMRKSNKYQGVKVLKSIPAEIRMMSPVSFKKKLKLNFLQQYEIICRTVLHRSRQAIFCYYSIVLSKLKTFKGGLHDSMTEGLFRTSQSLVYSLCCFLSFSLQLRLRIVCDKIIKLKLCLNSQGL